MGAPLMPWQDLVVDVALEVQSAEAGDEAPGEWAYDEVGVSIPRQGGKTYLMRPVIVHRLRRWVGSRVWTTAQKGTKARARFLDMAEHLRRSPIADEFKILRGVGHEEATWKETGSSMVPFAPTGDDLHGETPDFVLVDELWSFDAEEARELRQAYLPGFTTKDAQAWLLSTAGDHRSAWLNNLRRRGRRAVETGQRRGLAWFEWTLPDEVDGVPVEDLDDEALVELCIRYHPAFGHTLRPASVRSAFVTMTEEDYATGRADFLRAYGNRTQATKGTRAIPEAAWLASRVDTPIPEDARFALAFEVDPDGLESTVTAVTRLPDGRGLAEVIDTRPGTRWVAPRVLELVEKWDPAAVGCNDAGPTRDVADLVEAAGVDVQRVGVRDYAAARVRIVEEWTLTVEGTPAPTFLHRGEECLDVATRSTGLRSAGPGSQVWAGSGITALVSATIGLWTYDHAPEPAPRRFRIG